MIRAFGMSRFYLILLFLLSLITEVESKNPAQRVEKERSQARTVEVLRVRFGSGPDHIGVHTPDEANPEGPMSFALGWEGEIYILDQINSRIQVFKRGKKTATIPIPAEEFTDFKDIELTPENKIVLLGRTYVEGREKLVLYLLDLNGKVLNKIPLEDRRLIPDSGMVLGIHVVKEGRLSGIWVELADDHSERSVRILSLDRKSIERISVPGKISFNGKRLLRAEKIVDTTVVLYRSEEYSLSKWEPERAVYFDRLVVHLLGLWDDQKERIFLGAVLEEGDKKKGEKLSNEFVVLSSDLKEKGRMKLVSQETPHEIWRAIRVSPEGNIYQMVVDKHEVVVRKYSVE
jgi:hypothetical protein